MSSSSSRKSNKNSSSSKQGSRSHHADAINIYRTPDPLNPTSLVVLDEAHGLGLLAEALTAHVEAPGRNS
jgi:hypothetical protein